MDLTLQAAIYRRADQDPGRRALGFYTSHRRCEWWTRAEVVERAERTATALAERGLGPGDVCVHVPYNDPFATDALLGSLFVGAIPLLVAPPAIQGMNSSLTDILHGIIERTESPLVVAADSVRTIRGELESRHPKTAFVFGPDELAADGRSAPHLPGPDDLAAYQLTSGTTGFPRICMWRQRNVMAALDGMASAMGVDEDDAYLNWTPLYHDMGLMNNFMLCLTRGIPLVMMSPFDFIKRPALWLKALHDTGANVTWSPNFGYALAAQRVRDEELEGIRLDHVDGFWNAAERIHHETIEAFRQRFTPFGLRPEALRTNFGCAENVGGATFTAPGEEIRVEHIDPAALHERQVAEPVDPSGSSMPVVSCGRPHAGITLHILDEAGDELPEGHVGELALDTVSRMEGFLDDPEATAAAFHGDLLKTGDLGYVREGELFWTGRVQERITVRGRKIDPSDFEVPLLTVPALRAGSFAAFGIDDPALGTQRIVIVSEVRPDHPLDDTRSRVKAAVSERLAVAVDDVVLVEQGTLTKTSSGKRRHRHFKEMYVDGRLAPFEVG